MTHDFSEEVNAAFAAFEEKRVKVVALPPVRFEFGPYFPPSVQIGDEVECAHYGLVRIVGWSEGPLPWPQCHINGPRSLILFEDLARAVAIESRLAVALAWGVSGVSVSKWRNSLEVERANAGAVARWTSNIKSVISTAQNKVGLERAHALATRVKAEATKRARGTTGKRIWTREQIAWMGQLTDTEIASRIGCHRKTVEKERHHRDIPRLASARYTSGFTRIDTARVQARLIELGIDQVQLARRYGCSFPVINAIHRGKKTRVTTETLDKLARALECSPANLLATDDDDDKAALNL